MAKPDKPPKDPPGGGGGGGGGGGDKGGGGGGGKPPKDPKPPKGGGGINVPDPSSGERLGDGRRTRDTDEGDPKNKKLKRHGDGAIRIGLNVPQPSRNGLNFPGG